MINLSYIFFIFVDEEIFKIMRVASSCMVKRVNIGCIIRFVLTEGLGLILNEILFVKLLH